MFCCARQSVNQHVECLRNCRFRASASLGHDAPPGFHLYKQCLALPRGAPCAKPIKQNVEGASLLAPAASLLDASIQAIITLVTIGAGTCCAVLRRRTREKKQGDFCGNVSVFVRVCNLLVVNGELSAF